MSLLETILTTSSSGGFALLGGWLTYRYNKKSLEAQHSLEKWKFDRNVMLTKAEELVSALSAEITFLWSKIEKYSLHGLNISPDENSFNELLDGLRFKQPELWDVLISVYFSELEPLRLQLVRKAHEGVSADFKFKMGEKFRDESMLEVSIAASETLELLQELKSQTSLIIRTKFSQ
ncbi:hypothetical protein ACK04L_001665 [Enterobacter roggenkampii]